MEAKNYQEEIEKLEKQVFITTILSYESDLIRNMEKSMNFIFEKFREAFKLGFPIDECEILKIANDIQPKVLETFSLSTPLIKIFEPFKYALNEEDEKIFFESKCILEIFSNYLMTYECSLKFCEEDNIFDFLYYVYYSETEEDKEKALTILLDFHFQLQGFIIYKDYVRLIKFFNRDFLVSPNDNHIPIRIAILNALNIINELNNSVPNKENIYRIIHAIVGGNEDNVKKYCLSLIGKNSLSQKQITKKHKEFAQKYINEKKL